jgi:hypothetical protein
MKFFVAKHEQERSLGNLAADKKTILKRECMMGSTKFNCLFPNTLDSVRRPGFFKKNTHIWKIGSIFVFRVRGLRLSVLRVLTEDCLLYPVT